MSKSARTIATFGRNKQFVEHLAKSGVEFLIVGGAAVHFYGCRDDGEVDDLDLLLDPSLTNAEAFIRALPNLGVTIDCTIQRLTQPEVQIPIKVIGFYLDIVTPKGGIDFPELIKRSERARLGIVDVRVIGKKDLIEMKRDAIDHQEDNVGKHWKDLECLMAV